MGVKTLREVCNTYHVTRRAVQGYEKANLLAPSGKNERGYLLYDEKAQCKIQQIRLYQQLGFTLHEIGILLDAPKEEVRKALEQQIALLRKNIKEKEALIKEAQKLIDTL